MRNAVFSLLSTDTALSDLGVKKVYASPALDTPPEEIFVVLSWQEVNAEFKDVGTQNLTVWVHNRQPDYRVINRIVARIKLLMISTFHRAGTDGVFVQAQWTGEGPDVWDDGFRTYVKTSGYRCNGKSST